MELDELLGLCAQQLYEALGQLGIGESWEIARTIRRAAFLAPSEPCLKSPREKRNAAFENLVVGTLAERAFRDSHLRPLRRHGFEIADYHYAGENRDFGVRRDGVELPINVKVASTLYREARRDVGLDPEDCIPLGAYKAIGASERVSGLVYVFLVDFGLRERVDAFMDSLDGDLAIGWDLLSWFGGRGMKRAQNEYIDVLFERHDADLRSLVPGVKSFRAISAQRALAIMRRLPRRVPGLGVKAAGTGVIRGEVNIHVSVEHETRSWDVLAKELKTDGIRQILDRIAQTTMAEVPDPQL